MPIEKTTVVILEDYSSIVPLTEKFFRSAGYQPVIFSNDKEALSYIKQNHDKIRSILVGYRNPGEKIYNFVHDIKIKYRGIKVVYFSLKDDSETPQKIKEILKEIPKEPITRKWMGSTLRYSAVNRLSLRWRSLFV